MNTIIRHIEYLISRNDCVIVPGFGTFLAQYQSAQFDPETSTFYPPQRIFTFNSSLTSNDGILANSISRSLGISFDRAMKTIKAEVSSMKRDLISNQDISIGRVGVIHYKQSDNTYHFIPFPVDKLSVSTLWLPDVDMPPIQKVETPVVASAPIKKHSYNLFTHIGRIAAIVALVFGIWFLASTPLHIDDAMKASLIPEININSSNDDKAESVEPVETTEALPQAEETLKVEVIPTDTDANYYVIVASSIDENEANSIVAKYPEYNLKVKNFGMQYRVYISSHATNEEAALGCIDARKNFPQAWFCSK